MAASPNGLLTYMEKNWSADAQRYAPADYAARPQVPDDLEELLTCTISRSELERFMPKAIQFTRSPISCLAPELACSSAVCG